MKRVVVNGKPLAVLTIGEFAQALGRATDTLRKYEKRGILPKANLKLKGNRCYSDALVKKVSLVFADVKAGIEITAEQKRQIAIAFQEERSFLNL